MIDLKSPVLVADIDEQCRDEIAKELEQLGFHRFLMADDRKSAATSLYKKSEDETVGLILVSDEIFEQDGKEYIEMVRSVDEFSETPIVAFSAEIDLEKALNYMDYGVLSFLVKPVSARKIAAALLLLKQPIEIIDDDDCY